MLNRSWKNPPTPMVVGAPTKVDPFPASVRVVMAWLEVTMIDWPSKQSAVAGRVIVPAANSPVGFRISQMLVVCAPTR